MSELLNFDFAATGSLGQAALLFLATFVLEDAAALGAGLSLGAGGIGWSLAFWPCFLGIWLGDAGLYALARWVGRPWFERSRFRVHAMRVAASEAWFARHGLGLLVLTRMLPGSRLPTYLAAGFLRVRPVQFLVITGLAAFGWTALILWLSRPLGARLQATFHLGARGMTLLGAGCVLALLLAGLGRRLPWREGFERAGIAWARARRWEFWPPWIFYLPVGLYCLWLAIKHRGLSLPAAANPGIFTGGLVGESKMATLAQLMETSPGFTAPAELIDGTTPAERLAQLRSAAARLQLEPPFILKPDLGQRGAGVKLVRNWEQAEAYARSSVSALLIQRYAPGPHEAGVFYYRFPGRDRGRLFALTEKRFPEITGDGRSTIAELVRRDPRARLSSGVYLRRFASRRAEVLPAGATLRLVEAGNHAQGCIFCDGARLITPALEERIDAIARRLDRFHIGRFDLRYSDPAAFARGEGFEIVELNGAAAEATSIYDARYSLAGAYRTLFRQWELVFAIGAANRRAGHRSESWRDVWREWRRFRKLSAGYAPAD